MAVTDNGSNMIKAINSIQFNGRQVNPSVGANGANADEAELTDESAGNTDDSELSEGWCKPRHFAEKLIFYLTKYDFFVTSLWLFYYSYSYFPLFRYSYS